MHAGWAHQLVLSHSAGHAGPFADGHLILCEGGLHQVQVLVEQGIGALEQGQRVRSSSSLTCSMLLPGGLPRMLVLLPWILLWALLLPCLLTCRLPWILPSKLACSLPRVLPSRLTCRLPWVLPRGLPCVVMLLLRQWGRPQGLPCMLLGHASGSWVHLPSLGIHSRLTLRVWPARHAHLLLLLELPLLLLIEQGLVLLRCLLRGRPGCSRLLLRHLHGLWATVEEGRSHVCELRIP